MQQYGLHFGFRVPYQVLRTFLHNYALLAHYLTRPVDAAILQDAKGFKMDFLKGLEKTLHGEVKPSQSWNLCLADVYV